MQESTGIAIQVIDGVREADYIYRGVREALDLGDEPSLVMDIGGGSVEFITVSYTHLDVYKRQIYIRGTMGVTRMETSAKREVEWTNLPGDRTFSACR